VKYVISGEAIPVISSEARNLFIHSPKISPHSARRNDSFRKTSRPLGYLEILFRLRRFPEKNIPGWCRTILQIVWNSLQSCFTSGYIYFRKSPKTV